MLRIWINGWETHPPDFTPKNPNTCRWIGFFGFQSPSIGHRILGWKIQFHPDIPGCFHKKVLPQNGWVIYNGLNPDFLMDHFWGDFPHSFRKHPPGVLGFPKVSSAAPPTISLRNRTRPQPRYATDDAVRVGRLHVDTDGWEEVASKKTCAFSDGWEVVVVFGASLHGKKIAGFIISRVITFSPRICHGFSAKSRGYIYI